MYDLLFQVSMDKGKDDKVYYGNVEIAKLLNQQQNLTLDNNHWCCCVWSGNRIAQCWIHFTAPSEGQFPGHSCCLVDNDSIFSRNVKTKTH